jgi:hypothetical protein
MVAKAMAPVVKTHALLVAVSRRGVKSLEGALSALSAPFVPLAANVNSEPMSPMSEVTLGSSMVDPFQDVMSSAEEVVRNARRKQAILVGIIIKLQAYGRRHLAKKYVRKMLRSTRIIKSLTEGDGDFNRSVGAVTLQTWVRSVQARYRFTIVRHTALRIGSLARGRRIRFAFLLLIDEISKVQALARGFIFRKRIFKVVANRLRMYRNCSFSLWQIAHTPLSYRTTFWFEICDDSFVRLKLAEKELRRVWKELQVEPKFLGDSAFADEGDETMRIAASVGLSNSFYWSVKTVCDCLTIVASILKN